MQKISDDELKQLMSQLKEHMDTAICCGKADDRKAHITGIYRLYDRIEAELKIVNVLIDDCEFMYKEVKTLNGLILKVAMSDTVTIKGQEFLLVPVSTPSNPVPDAPFERPMGDFAPEGIKAHIERTSCQKH